VLANPALSQPLPHELNLREAAPDSFFIHFETSRGAIRAMAVREWSPLGVDRLWHLVRGGYYNDVIIFRVGGTMSATGMVAQFGITGNPAVNAAWEDQGIPDEPVLVSNKRGTLIFARGGPGTRSTQLALNLTDNPGLDTVDFMDVTGFPPVARVVEGMEVADAFYSRYGNEPSAMQDSISAKGNAWLEAVFPGLDRIIRAVIVGD
jgi:peptidyl-prolyl cis-trans isomerase A (cyclophilin A)